MNCGLIFRAENDFLDRGKAILHYSSIDPHESVGAAKRKFFRKALGILSRTKSSRSRKILDIGCGFGYFLDLAARYGWDVYGVEIVKQGVETSRAKFGKAKIHHGTLNNANHRQMAFDAITLWDVLVEINDPFSELNECYRILRDGGTIGIRVRNSLFQKLVFYFHSRFQKVANKIGIKKPYVFHQYSFNRKSITSLLTRAGFSNIKVRNSPLSQGDPYKHVNNAQLIKLVKYMIVAISEATYFLSFGRIIIGPSLLIWAEKPYAYN
jgi:2-polyprenyl-3-methyl-5-hydroxy-6-metoxy-1,4-benzoquinol methylase